MLMTPPEHQRASLYSPLGFLRGQEEALGAAFFEQLNDKLQGGHTWCVEGGLRLLVSYLPWDSEHFGCPFYKIEYADGPDGPERLNELTAAIGRLKQELAVRHAHYYLFAEVPSEDVAMLQALGLSAFRLIETRLTYFQDEGSGLAHLPRFEVREACEADIPNLREVALSARNLFDRYHADPFFSPQVADEYLATFVENSIRGFADHVLVPNEGQREPGAFFTAQIERSPCAGTAAVGRIVLVAVGGERQGWHLKLLSEMSHLMRERGVALIHMTTQSTNRAVIRNCEKLGYRYGRSTHVLSTFQ